VFVPGIFVAIWLGQKIPIVFAGDPARQQQVWDVIILVYCFFASITPMWILLQPRGYLGGFILYTTFAVGLAGVFFGRTPTAFPAFRHALRTGGASLPVFPLLFTTIACGACSGFHGLVASGTSSKQIARESDARIVGYGGMLLESFVAVVAMATLMIISPGDKLLDLGPDEIYARGLAHFMGVFGIPFGAAVSFGKLAFATFIYDTLDVSTRLGRYVVEEIFDVRGRAAALVATAATVVLPLVCVFTPFHDAAGQVVPMWKTVWPAFGASNQLLAALTLMSVSVWLKREGRSWWVTGLPGVFMTVVSMASLVDMVRSRTALVHSLLDPVAATGVVLIALGVVYLACLAPRLVETAEHAAEAA
jgi:carbon starvation protein